MWAANVAPGNKGRWCGMCRACWRMNHLTEFPRTFRFWLHFALTLSSERPDFVRSLELSSMEPPATAPRPARQTILYTVCTRGRGRQRQCEPEYVHGRCPNDAPGRCAQFRGASAHACSLVSVVCGRQIGRAGDRGSKIVKCQPLTISTKRGCGGQSLDNSISLPPSPVQIAPRNGRRNGRRRVPRLGFSFFLLYEVG